jgi:hypothetical protein
LPLRFSEIREEQETYQRKLAIFSATKENIFPVLGKGNLKFAVLRIPQSEDGPVETVSRVLNKTFLFRQNAKSVWH